MRKVLSVQNIACETLGTLQRLLKADGFEIESKSAQELKSASSAGYSAIVILGGPMAVYDNLPYLQKEQELIRDAIKNDIPLLGICLGSQLIAQAAGGHVFKGARKEIGLFDVSLSGEGKKGLFAGLESPMKVFQWHGDTYELPKEAEVLAYSDLYPQAFKIGSAYGIQFHLEVDRPMVESWIKEYDSEVRAEKLDRAKVAPKASEIERLVERCQKVYRNFVKINHL
ncbi:type 1 glutamine amidotransferase [Nitrososphaera sp.]|uniref:type 1 glutamine amidotransferase n=1 Tax=Nitrososphaera sp. TaxID=1971748 RepID=UPI0017BC6A6F|nr:type 1 glutamine amidotransferase [Nitrososphaera sp.]NWG37352.1 type 1 glutamine amidotransferase [Nitrososphaera sp.]